MIKIIRVDEIHKYFECDGKGYIEFTDYNSLERFEKKCDQCQGSGLLKLTGNIEISPFIAYNRICHNNQK